MCGKCDFAEEAPACTYSMRDSSAARPLHMRCPTFDCASNDARAPIQWQHGDCTGCARWLYLKSDGSLGCGNASHGHWKIWAGKFKCANDTNYEKADITNLSQYVTVMIGLATKEADVEKKQFYCQVAAQINIQFFKKMAEDGIQM